MKKVIRILFLSGFLAVGAVTATSCSLDPTLTNSVDNQIDPITDAATMKAAVNGIFARMKAATYYGRDIIIFSEVRNAYAYSNNRSGRFGNVSGGTLTETAAYASDTWAQIYRTISEANRVLEAELEETAAVKAYRGQAYVLRALAHYDLLRLYGQQYFEGKGLTAMGIPYVTKFANKDTNVTRQSVKENMDAIFSDLDNGVALLKESNANISKTSLSLASSLALKSRIALFFSHFDSSKFTIVSEAAKESIDLATASGVEVASRSSFLDTYKGEGVAANSLFELAQSGTDNLMTNSLFYIYNITPQGVGYGPVRWNTTTEFSEFFKQVQNGMEVRDIRQDILGTMGDGALGNVGKYTAMTSNIKMIRIEEVMFNYIEANVEAGIGSSATALEYLNEVVSNRIEVRAEGSSDSFQPFQFTAGDLATVYRDQRTKELMFEGFGFEDIARWQIDYINPTSISNPYIPAKDGIIKWDSYFTAFPIPLGEINVSKIPQNEGY
ncbi:RagB/SusD family nutrient uptake outer membrane protein [Myroides sp. LJL119]